MRYLKLWMLAVGLAAVGTGSAKAAGVTYLECKMTTGGAGADMTWQITLDESAQTVTFKHSEAEGVRPGVFTPDMVFWNDGRFSVSRIDLSFSLTSLGVTDKGKCKVVTPPKRAF